MAITNCGFHASRIHLSDERIKLETQCHRHHHDMKKEKMEKEWVYEKITMIK